MGSAVRGWKNPASGGTSWTKRKECLRPTREEEAEPEAPQKRPERATSAREQTEKADTEKVPD